MVFAIAGHYNHIFHPKMLTLNFNSPLILQLKEYILQKINEGVESTLLYQLPLVQIKPHNLILKN